MEIDSKIFLASTRITGDKHSELPRTMGGDAPRCPGEQARSIHAHPDGAESINSSLPPHCMKKYF